MLIAVRAKVESVDHWKEKFKTHGDLFKRQGVSIAHMGAADDQTVIAVLKPITPMNLFEYLMTRQLLKRWQKTR